MTKNLENLEKTTDGIRVGSGSYLVNKKHIVVGKPSKTCVLDIQEVGSDAAQGMSGRNIAIYGMAAVVESEDDPSVVNLAENATLINEGIIEIYLDEMVEAYKDQLKANKDDTSKLYNVIRCYAMGAGKNSLLINEGIIRLHIDQKDGFHPGSAGGGMQPFNLCRAFAQGDVGEIEPDSGHSRAKHLCEGLLRTAGGAYGAKYFNHTSVL